MTAERSRAVISFCKTIVAVAALTLFVTSCSVTASVSQGELSSGAPTEVPAGFETLPVEPAAPADPEPISPTPVEPPPDDSSPAEPALVEPATDELRPSPADVAPGTAVVYLVDPGAEPRGELRLTIAASCGEVLTITQTQEITQSINGVAQSSQGAVGTVIEMAVSATPTGDNYEIRAEITNAQAAPGTAATIAPSLNAELAAVIGLTTISTMTDRALQVPGSARVVGAEALGPFADLVDSASQAQSPLPLEAVGVGAVWEVISVIDLQGANVATITETELVSISGTTVELRLNSRQEVAIGAEMSAAGAFITIEEWDVAASGTLTLDLATISPISSHAVSTGTQSFSSGSGITTADVSQDLRSEIDIVGAPNDGCTGRTTNP